MRTIEMLLVTGALLLVAPGCRREAEVSGSQTPSAFAADVENKLKDLENRIAEAKDQKPKLGEGLARTLETATEMAEEQIETLRDTSLPTLRDAAAAEAEAIKAQINETLVAIDRQITKAEDAIKRGLSEKEEFTQDVTDRLGKLDERMGRLRTRLDGLGDAAKSKATVALETAEEALQEARGSVDRYRDAAADNAAELRRNVADLLKEAGNKLDDAEKTVQPAADG